MKLLKTTYVLLIVIGLLSIVAYIYLYFTGKQFNDYFISGILGLIFTATGFASLHKQKKNGVKE